jgi:hypothetical protein
VENTGYEVRRVVWFEIWSSEGGSPYLCQLGPASVRSEWTSIDYVLVHKRFMGSRKLSSFDGDWVGWHPTLLHVCTIESCSSHPRCVHCGIRVEDDTRVRWARLDSLIVIVKYWDSWCLLGLRVPCCRVFCPCKVTIYYNLRDNLGYGWGLFTASKRSNWTSFMIHMAYEMDVVDDN